jgi:hypothetical protein
LGAPLGGTKGAETVLLDPFRPPVGVRSGPFLGFSDGFLTAFSEVRMRRFLAYKAVLASVDLLWLSRQRSEGGSLLRSAQDAHRVPGLEPQVRPGVSYHPLAPHDRQH